jgi:hypothetical protein
LKVQPEGAVRGDALALPGGHGFTFFVKTKSYQIAAAVAEQFAETTPGP